MANLISTTVSTTEQLVKIIQSDFNGESINAVNARDLHEFLEVQTRFDKWFDRRVTEYGFIRDSDFCPIVAESSGGRPAVEYHLTLDTAKEISMVERNEKGRQARKYFIEMEKRARREIIEAPKLSTTVEEFKAGIELAHMVGLKDNQAILSANMAVKNMYGIDCLQTMGVCGLIAEDKKQFFTPSVLGKKIDMSAQKFNKALETAGMQTAARDHKKRLVWVVTDAGKQYCQLLDINKKHSDGTPIHRIMWCEGVLDALQEVAA